MRRTTSRQALLAEREGVGLDAGREAELEQAGAQTRAGEERVEPVGVDPHGAAGAAVPHYVSLAPSPRAALALCGRLAELLETTIDASELEQAAESYSEQVSEAVAADPDTQAYVEQLEQRSDELGTELDLPSGDSIAAELTRYLREREEDDGRQGPSAQ